jgi:hypothetical protein
MAGLVFAATLSAATLSAAPVDEQGKGKPSINLRSNPTIAFAPARVVVTAELSGGADDFQEFYCAQVEWVWGDGTKSESQDDCDPYVAGDSRIRRRFSNEHKYEFGGNYEVRFNLKQGRKIVGSGTTTIRVRDAQ